MKLAIMQPYFFPYLGYFQLIAAVDKFIPYYYLNYIVNGWINRNRLLIVNKEPVYFTVSVKQKSGQQADLRYQGRQQQPLEKKHSEDNILEL